MFINEPSNFLCLKSAEQKQRYDNETEKEKIEMEKELKAKAFVCLSIKSKFFMFGITDHIFLLIFKFYYNGCKSTNSKRL